MSTMSQLPSNLSEPFLLAWSAVNRRTAQKGKALVSPEYTHLLTALSNPGANVGNLTSGLI